jgi:hypothetical protein
VYFETNPTRVRGAANRLALQTHEAKLLKGMPGTLVTTYQRLLRYHGVDNMSSTGGLVSSSHTEDDIARATSAFGATVRALRDEGLVLSLR